jgi:hypothetical protein
MTFFDNEQVYDFLAGQAAEANETVNAVEDASSFTVIGAATGQVAIWNGTEYVPASITGESASGLSVGVITSPSLSLQVSINNPANTRTKLGLGGLALLNSAAASADTAPAQTAAYVQADVQAILAELRDLKSKLRASGVLST